LRKRFALVAGNDVALRHTPAISLRDAPELSKNSPPLYAEGAGKAGRRLAPAASCAKWKTHELVTTGEVGSIRLSPRDGFNGFLRALPSDRAFLPLSSA
jgi:hypothetical protein